MKTRNEFDPLIEKNMADSNPLKIVLIILAFVAFIVVAIFNAIAATPNGAGIFNNRTGDISDALYIEITPAGWTFSIWGFIYAWQAAWLIYSLTTICRRKAGTHLYMLPIYPAALYIAFIFNNVFNVGWLFAWDNFKLAIALPLIALTPFTLYICLFFSLKKVYDNLDYINQHKLRLDLWLNRILIQNGIAFYAAWVTIATLINFGLVLTYKDGSDLSDIGVAQDVSGTICLSIALVEVMVWFTLDIFFLDRYTRYLFSPYITLTVAFAGVVQKNYNLDTAYRNSVFSVVLLVIAAVSMVTKFTVMVVRHIKHPITPNKAFISPTV